jgi:hypothetical protein
MGENGYISAMSAPGVSEDDLIYAGSHCHCYRLPQAGGTQPARFVIVAHIGNKVIGQLLWHTQWQRYCLIPAPDTAWASSTLSEVGLWLRRLSQSKDLLGRGNGH